MITNARRYLAAGLCVLPAGTNKAPAVPSWARYQKETLHPDEIGDHFTDKTHGIGFVCGAVSGGLEVADLDAKNDPAGTLNARSEAAIKEAAPGLWERLVIEATPSGGRHLYFRSGATEGNLKLARRHGDGGRLDVLAETRGEGGFIVAAPTPGYLLLQGSLEAIPLLTDDEREDLLSALRSLDEMPEVKREHPATHHKGSELSPIDDFDARGDALELLRRHGWHVGPVRGDGSQLLRRPGKKAGWSATWNHGGKGRLCVFSSSTPFALAPSTYSPAGIYGVLECGGDFVKASAELRRLNFGGERPKANDQHTTQGSAEAKPPLSVALLDLSAPSDETRAADNLLGNGFLRRDQTGVIVGPTGIGKSSLTMQAALCWGIGRAVFGIRPQAPLRVLIVQSENDDADLAEMRDGILAALDFSPTDKEMARENIRVLRSFSFGAAWLVEIAPEVEQHRPDLLIVDPLFAFAGVDLAKDQPGLSHFLRGLVLPFTIKHRLGVLLVHHTNKPPTSAKDRSVQQAGDFAYSGSGHNELANFPRFVAVLRSLGSRSVFELRLGKRWKRAGIVDDQGNPIDRVLIKHADRGISWENATETDLRESIEESAKQGGARKSTVDETAKIAEAFFAIAKDNAAPLAKLANRLKTSERTLRRRFGDARVLINGDDVLTLNLSTVRLIETPESVCTEAA
jgi:hypothetical protein